MVARNQIKDRDKPAATDEVGTRPRKMKQDDILALVRAEIANATGALTSNKLTENRRKALQYYMGDPYGDEVKGRSQVITTEFRDTVESLLPQLVKIFLSSDQIVTFEPERPSDEAGAQQATDYINHVFMKENQGFTVLYTMIKDALMFKNGIVKIYWEETQKVSKNTYRGLNEAERDAILSGDGVEPVEYTEYEGELPGKPDPGGLFGPNMPVKLCDLVTREVDTKGRGRVVPVPPDEFLISQRTASIQAARFVCHRTPKTVSDLVEMGFSKKEAEELAGDVAEGEYNEERQQRFVYDGDASPSLDSQDASVRPVWVHECYLLIDIDMDGIAEKWKITVAGDQHKLSSMEEWEGDWPFESISPIMMPHKFWGISIFDLVQQWQRIQSTMVRQFLDNVYGINNNRIAVQEDRVNLDDLLTNRPNQIVRTQGNPAESVMPLMPQSLGGVLIPGMEYFNSVREKSTGVTSYNQGLDADSLNKTASGISQIMGAAQERILLIARIFADTGICGIFRQLLQLTCKHMDKEKTIRLRDKWVNIDPRQWNAGMNASTDVALGTNNKDQMLLHLNQVLAIQEKGIPMGLATPQNIYNTLKKVIENTGLKHVEPYFVDPSTAPPMPKPPSEEEIKAKAAKELKAMDLAGKEQTQMQQAESAAREKLASTQLEIVKIRAAGADAAKQRELDLRIAREKNLTDLVKSDMQATAKAQAPQPDGAQKPGAEPEAEAEEPKPKKPQQKLSRMQIARDADGNMSDLIPVYEDIIDEADPEDAP